MTLRLGLALVMTVLFPGAPPDERTPDKTIEVTVRDGKPVFTEEGKKKPGAVTLVVGQTVRWVNRDRKPHHFVSAAEADGKPVVDTGVIEPGKHHDLMLDNTLYRLAGGKTAGVVALTFRSRGGDPDPVGTLEILSPAKRGPGRPE